MSYKIAVASTDQVVINRSFRDAEDFLIFEVDDKGEYKVGEIRKFNDGIEKDKKEVQTNCGSKVSCGENSGCGSGTGCGGDNSPKLLLIEDCRCLVCTKIGFKIHKQLTRKAISAFEIECKIDDSSVRIENVSDWNEQFEISEVSFVS